MQLTAEQRHRVVYELGLTYKGIKDLAVICRHCRTPREVDGLIDGMARALQMRSAPSPVRRLTEAETPHPVKVLWEAPHRMPAHVLTLDDEPIQ